MRGSSGGALSRTTVPVCAEVVEVNYVWDDRLVPSLELDVFSQTEKRKTCVGMPEIDVLVRHLDVLQGNGGQNAKQPPCLAQVQLSQHMEFLTPRARIQYNHSIYPSQSSSSPLSASYIVLHH